MHFEWGKVVKTINWTFVFNLVNFALLLWLLKRLLYKPALEYLDRRRERVSGRIEKAKEDQESAHQLLEERKQALQGARDHQRSIVEEARSRAEKIVDQGKEDAKQEAERILQNARLQTEQDRAEMEEALRQTYAEIAVMGASKVLNREVSTDDHRQLLDELLEQLDATALGTKR